MCVLVDGKVAQELANGTTIIPFGSEYVLRFRNKNHKRAVVKFSIDGEDASGSGYVIPANSSIDIKRYAHKDVAFKFVDLNSPEAIEFGKNGDNKDKIKGVVEAHFYLEKDKAWNYSYYKNVNQYWDNKYMNQYYYTTGSPISAKRSINTNDSSQFVDWELPPGTTLCSSGGTTSSNNVFVGHSYNLKDGTTVEGTTTGQSFSSVHIELESDFVVLKTFLQGCDKDFFIPAGVSELDKRASNLEDENKKLKEKIILQEKIKEEFLKSEKIKLLEEENKILRERLESLKKS